MLTLLLAGLGAVIIAVVWMIAYVSRHRKPAFCVNCGAPSGFGYSIQAESAMKDITRLCLNCLKAKLANDYEQFGARALVIDPAANLPCYVFQPGSKWKDCRLMEDAGALLSRMQDSCHHCGAKANFLWLTSSGLQLNNQDKLFSEGLSETLLQWGNRPPYSVCGRCCVNLICESIENRGLMFVEVCGPRSEDGLVLPMAY